jgi:diacylglycerol kinase (ATP)
MRSFTALINPVSGGGVAPRLWNALADRLASAGAPVTVELTRSREHATEAAAAAALRGDVVVAVGGDGLARDAAAGIVTAAASAAADTAGADTAGASAAADAAAAGATADAAGALAIIPAGRGNDLARKLGLPHDPAGQCDLLLNAAARSVDVIEADGQLALGNVYMGIDSTANAIINSNRWMPGALLYRLAPVQVLLTWKPPAYTIVADGQKITTRAHTVVVANSGAYGHGLRIVPDAKLDDGMLDVLIVGVGPKRQIASFMTQAKHGTHVRRPEVRIIKVREISVDTDRPVPVGIDGEDLGHTPCTMRIRPAALRLIW